MGWETHPTVKGIKEYLKGKIMQDHIMQIVINEAWKYQGLAYPNPGVGAAVVCRGELVSLEVHHRAGTSHAEVMALVRAYEKMSGSNVEFDPYDAFAAHDFLRSLPEGFFGACEIFVTLEPCNHLGRTPACAGLLEHLRPARVVIAMRDPISEHSGGVERLRDAGIEVILGIREKEARELLEPFVIWQKRAFVLFKLAQTSNGRIGGGYLSSPDSLHHVHRMREVCSRLLIGGGTVRADRPTLDCRFSGGRAPDVTIYSRTDDFDWSIPLFGIEGRNVEIGDDLSFLEKPSFVIVEGGEGMLRAMEKHIDWLLIYQTPKLSIHNLTYNIAKELTFLHTEPKGVDIMIWSKWRDGKPSQ